MTVRLSLALTAVLVAVGAFAACSAPAGPSTALLPAGIDEARVPEVESSGYVYFRSDPPLALRGNLFRISPRQVGPTPEIPEVVGLESATLVVAATSDSFGGLLKFASEADAQAAWLLVEEASLSAPVWGKLAPPQLLLAGGPESSRDAFQRALETGRLVSLRQYDPSGWNLMTRLPESPPFRPVAAGIVKLDGDILETVKQRIGLDLEGIGIAFAFVRVDSVAFGVYADTLPEISSQIDLEFLRQSGSGVLLVSHSEYPEFLVSFMVSVIAGRTGMETIALGSTNARYRALNGSHLVLKNKGSFMFAGLAGNRTDAERLVLSAVSD